MNHLQTLVLNNNYMPLSLFPLYTITAEDAITRYLNGNCTVVEWYDRPLLTASRDDLKWPSVIANFNGHSFKKDAKLARESLYYRDHCVCQYCGNALTLNGSGDNKLTYDHVVPRAKGGKHSFDNVVASCKLCNNKKGDTVSNKWTPKNRPWTPSFYEMLKIRSKYPIVVRDEKWKNFLPNWTGDIIVEGPK